MVDVTVPTNKILPRNRPRLLISFAVIAYSVFLGEIYSYVNFNVWLITHLLVMLVLGAGLLWPALKQRSWPYTSLDIPLLAMAFTMAISALLSPWPRLALEGIFTWLSHILAFYLVVRLMYRGWADSLLRALMLVTGVVVLIGLFELAAWYFGLSFVPQFSQGWWEIGGFAHPVPPVWHRLSFTLANAVVLSAYLVLVIPAVIAFAITTRRTSDKPLVWLFVLATLLVLAATRSRGSWLGLGAGLTTGTILWLWRNYRHFLPRRRKTVMGLLVLVNVAILAAIVFYIWVLWDTRGSSNAERLAYWQAAAQIFTENPVWGIGPGLFRWGWRLTSFATQISDRVVSAHSIYFNHMAELGTVGALTGLWLLAVAGYTALRVLHNTQNKRLWQRRAGCAAGLVAFLVQGLFETFAIWPIVLPVIILAAYLIAPYHQPVAVSVVDTAPRKMKSAFRRYAGPLVAVGWLFCAALISYFAYPRFLAEQARKLAAGNQAEQAIALISQSSRLDPGLTLYQFELANWLANPDVANYRQAQQIYQKAISFEPAYGLNHANLAVIEWQLGNRQAALNQMERATQLSPKTPQFWLTLGTYAEEMRDDERAILAYTRAITIRPDWASSGFWQATPWRINNFPLALAKIEAQTTPDQYDFFTFYHYMQTGNLSDAEITLNRIGKQGQRSVAYHFAAAELSLAQNNPKLALEQLQTARLWQPNSAQTFALQAEALIETGELEQAELSLKQAMFLGRSAEPRAFFATGLLRQAQGLQTEAEAAFQRSYGVQAFSLDYGVAMYRQLGSLLPLFGLKNTSGGPESARGWFALAKLHKQNDRLNEAAQVYRALLFDDPFLEQAKEELEKLCLENQDLCQ